MKQFSGIGLIAFITFSGFANALEPKFHCKGIEDSTYEVIFQQGSVLTKKDVQALPFKVRKKVLDAEQVSRYSMVIFRGESTPQTLEAIGAQSDVYLKIFNLTGPEVLNTYLDELDATSFRVDGKKIDMNCSVL